MQSGKHVLIVDDDTDLTDILSEKLTEAGCTVSVAHNGEEGLRVALEKKPDLILLDVKMPKMDGITMLEHLRKDPWGESVHVILLTVLDQPETVSKAIELHGFEYFVKTAWKIEDIVKKVKENIEV